MGLYSFLFFCENYNNWLFFIGHFCLFPSFYSTAICHYLFSVEDLLNLNCLFILYFISPQFFWEFSFLIVWNWFGWRGGRPLGRNGNEFLRWLCTCQKLINLFLLAWARLLSRLNRYYSNGQLHSSIHLECMKWVRCLVGRCCSSPHFSSNRY